MFSQLVAENQAYQCAPTNEQAEGQQAEKEEQGAGYLAVGDKEHPGHGDHRQDGTGGQAAVLIHHTQVLAPIVHGEDQHDAHPDNREEVVQLFRQADGEGHIRNPGQPVEQRADRPGDAQGEAGQDAIQDHGEEGEGDGKSAEHREVSLWETFLVR